MEVVTPANEWPIFVISLSDDKARRTRIASQLEGLRLAFEFVDAVDGRIGISREMLDKVDQDAARQRIGRALSDPEIACAFSHRLVYETILDRGMSGAIVLEDDAVLLADFKKLVEARAYLGTHLLQFEYSDTRVYFLPRTEIMPGYRRARVATSSGLTVGYAISAPGARHILKHGLPLTGPADWPCDTTRIGHAVVIPKLVHHPESGETPSHIATARAQARLNTSGGPGPRRFLSRRYWRRWIRKRLSVRIA